MLPPGVSMGYIRSCACICALLLPFLASCTGNGPRTQIPPQTLGSDLQPHTFALRTQNAASATMNVHSDRALPDTAVSLRSSSCPSFPTITISNPFDFPIHIRIVSFSVTLPCAPQQPLFGASFYQIQPQLPVVTPVKLGDATVKGRVVTFTPTVQAFTLAPKSTSQIVILPEASTSDVAFPVAPGSTTTLTANASNLPSGLNFQYQTASGGTTYSAGCFNAFDSNGHLVPPLQGIPLVGTPSFYCNVTPASGNITFGNIVTFTITTPKPDRAIFEPDGNPQGFACTPASQCNVPAFSVPTTYQNFIAGNVQDLRLCAPATPSVDCNGVAGDPQGGSRTSVPARRPFQVLVADDPTYAPGTANAPVPWDGLFRMQLSGACILSPAPDNNNGDTPPNYTDDEQKGVGPNAEFDVKPIGTGTCTITTSEDTRYIIDYSNPANPQPRTATLSVTVGG